MINTPPILQLSGIVKSFSKVEVLHGVDFELQNGEIHALVGENGAGKSTLVKIISGVIERNAGSYKFQEEEVNFRSTLEAIERGISIVHQEFNLIPAFSVADNIFLGREMMKSVFIDKNEMYKRADEISKSVKLNIPVTRLVRDLTVAQQQLVEIAKCISTDSKVVIMDEPTAPLSIDETEKLFSLIKDLKSRGISIIYITHRLDEVFKISDRITVMRDGCNVGTYLTKDITKDFLIEKMVGRDLSGMYKHEVAQITDETVLKVNNLSCARKRLKNISFELKRGEILGFSGLVGAGRTELFECIFGITPFETGEIEFKGEKIKFPQIHKMIANGMGYVPEDRKRHGILTKMNVRENLTLPNIKECLKRTFISRKKENAMTRKIIDMLNIKCSKYTQKLMNLSGGNQQKISVGKWLTTDIDVLIMDEPTRGVDVGAKSEIYKIISELCKTGISIIIISSEMPEIIGMCSRVIVMCEGRITGEVSGKDITEYELMRLAVQREN